MSLHPFRVLAVIVAVWLVLFLGWCYLLYRVGRLAWRTLGRLTYRPRSELAP